MSAPKLAFSSRPTLSSTIPRFLVGAEAVAMEQALTEKINERARLIFEQSGNMPGNDEANWLRAESEILRYRFDVRESGTWLSLNASIPTSSGHDMEQDIQIVVTPTRVIVRARDAGTGQNSSEPAEQEQRKIFLAASLNAEVEPSSAAASFRDRNLRLMIKKRNPGNLTARSEDASK